MHTLHYLMSTLRPYCTVMHTFVFIFMITQICCTPCTIDVYTRGRAYCNVTCNVMQCNVMQCNVIQCNVTCISIPRDSLRRSGYSGHSPRIDYTTGPHPTDPLPLLLTNFTFKSKTWILLIQVLS